jgi:hypothetical protein
MYVVRIDALQGRQARHRAFGDANRARQSFNAACWKVFHGLEFATYLYEAPNESGAVTSIRVVRQGGGTLIARSNEDGSPPKA